MPNGLPIAQTDDALISGGLIRGRSPRDDSELDPVESHTHDDVIRYVAAARQAQAQWSQLSPVKRGRKVKALAGALLARGPQLAEIMAVEQGKSAAESYTSEILPSADLFTYWAKAGPRLLIPETKALNPINFPRKVGVMTLQPKGVVGVIAPWNYPLSIPLRTLVPALVAGNAVVFKPSEFAARIGQAIGELFKELEMPGLVAVVQGGPGVGASLLETEIDHVVFTGSVETGRKVAVACADRLMSYSLELGGKDAALVLADADLDRAADGIVWSAFANAGQNCASVERVYVVESVATRFVDKVLERTGGLKVGGNDDGTFDVGPLVRPQGLRTVEQHIEDALNNGATVRAGGKSTGVGRHFQPTVVTDVDEDMAIMTSETFGPVMPIAVVKDDDEAVARANKTVYGLTASIWTKNLVKGRRLSQKLECGVVTINNHGFTGALPHAPWAGRGHSGGGVTNSRHAFVELVEPRYLLIDRARKKEMWWFPHNSALEHIARNLAILLGKGGSKLAALIEVLKTFPKRWKS